MILYINENSKLKFIFSFRSVYSVNYCMIMFTLLVFAAIAIGIDVHLIKMVISDLFAI